MVQLSYSAPSLAGRAILGLVVAPLPIVLATDQRLQSGHVRGLWTGLLYEIGPVGRWAVAAAIIAAILGGCFGSFVILLSDRVAVRATPTGLFARTFYGTRQLPWGEILSIDLITRATRGRSYQWLCIRTTDGLLEKRRHISASMLDADQAEIRHWLMEARNLKAGRHGTPERALPTTTGFGRKRPLTLG